jgi:hypothetical protein
VMVVGYVNLETRSPCRRIGWSQKRGCRRDRRQIRRGIIIHTRRLDARKRDGRVEIQRTKKLFDALGSTLCVSRRFAHNESKTAHIIDRVGASLLPAVADSADVFFVVDPEEVDRAEYIFVPSIGGRKRSRATSVVRPRSGLFLFSALRKGGDSLLPGSLGGVGLRGPYGGRKAARWQRNVLQDGDEWLRRPHGGWETNA